MIDLITEENDNNGAVIKLSRPLTRSFDIYLNYSYYSNESSTRNLDFHKNIAASVSPADSDFRALFNFLNVYYQKTDTSSLPNTSMQVICSFVN